MTVSYRFARGNPTQAKISFTTRAVHVGQAEVAAGVAVGQPLVIEAQQVQDRRVQVVDVDLVLDGVVAVVVGRAVAEAALDAAAGQPHREALRVVVAAVVPPCAVGVRPNSPPQRTSVSSSRPRAFRSVQQAGDRLVDLAGVLRVALLEVAVLVPLHVRVAVRDLHEAHAALGEPAGQQALPAEVVGDRVVEAVERLRRRRSRSARSSTSGIAVCMRKASSNESMRPSSAWSGPVACQVLAVHLGEQVELQPLHVARRVRALSM